MSRWPSRPSPAASWARCSSRDLVVTEDQIAEALAQQKGLLHVNLASVEIDRAPSCCSRGGWLGCAGSSRSGSQAAGSCSRCQTRSTSRRSTRRSSGRVTRSIPSSHRRVRSSTPSRSTPSPRRPFSSSSSPTVRGIEEPEDFAQAEIEGDVPVVRIVNQLLREAVADRASDVHFEPEEDRVRVRYRIDGVLQDVASLPKNVAGRAHEPHQGHGRHGHHRAAQAAGRQDRPANRRTNRSTCESRHCRRRLARESSSACSTAASRSTPSTTSACRPTTSPSS